MANYKIEAHQYGSNVNITAVTDGIIKTKDEKLGEMIRFAYALFIDDELVRYANIDNIKVYTVEERNKTYVTMEAPLDTFYGDKIGRNYYVRQIDGVKFEYTKDVSNTTHEGIEYSFSGETLHVEITTMPFGEFPRVTDSDVKDDTIKYFALKDGERIEITSSTTKAELHKMLNNINDEYLEVLISFENSFGLFYDRFYIDAVDIPAPSVPDA